MTKSGHTRHGKRRWVCKVCKRSTTGGGVAGNGVREEVEEARDPVLTAYRHVLANKSTKWDETGLERTARSIHEENPQRFMDRYQELEAAERVADGVSLAGKAVAAGVVGVDEAGIRELIRDLLAEMRKPEVA